MTLAEVDEELDFFAIVLEKLGETLVFFVVVLAGVVVVVLVP